MHLTIKMEKAIGSEELEKALEQIASGNASEATKGIEIALGIEQESISFYTAQAEKTKGTEREQFFRFLAKQEEGHLEAINSLKESLETKGTWIKPVLPGKERPEIFAKKDWDKKDLEGLTAVLFALWKEKQAQEFYEKIAEKVNDAQAKEFFKALAEFEKGHGEMLSEYAEESYYSHELIMG